MSVRIAILASGSGSNAENIIKYFDKSKKYLFPMIISNKADAFIHQRAQKLSIPSFTFTKDDFQDGHKIIRLVLENKIDCIVLAGFLLKIPTQLIQHFPDRIINIHPALLPKYGGKGMYGNRVHQAVVNANETESGITIHYVNENYDEGNTIFQAKCVVNPTDTAEDIANKVHTLEYKHFPEVIEDIWG